MLIAPDLIDLIYEAALLPERWVSVLERLGHIVDCDKVFLFGTNEGRGVNGAFFNENGRAAMHTFISDGWAERNEQAPRTIARGDVDFTVDLDLLTPQEIAVSPYYQEFLVPHGMAWGTGTAIQSPSDDTIIVSLHRAYNKGPVSKTATLPLTALRPHLARASLLSARLRMEEARAAVSALAAMGLPAAALHRGGRLALANPLFDALVPSLVQDRATRLSFVPEAADDLFSDALQSPGLAGSFPVVAFDKRRFIAHLLPVSGAGRDVFSSLDTILTLVPVTLDGEADARIIQGLFDLTPAEARVARGIVLGQTPEAIARNHGTALETVRTQIKNVLAKTGTRRQAELVAMLGAAKRPVIDR
jgi:DNA-binding CsgD family transcriptional regulator